MTAYYNEIDPYAAQWLRNLIAAGHIAPGEVDERSILDVRPDDLAGFTQCHFFAGIGGWSFAARLAGWPDDRELWTGSCPCQPFSVAGKGEGQADERHLWPEQFRLISARRPDVWMGEQVAAAVGKHWLDGVHSDLESIGYSSGAAVVPACAVDAPHKRDRAWIVADRHVSEPGSIGRDTREVRGIPEEQCQPELGSALSLRGSQDGQDHVADARGCGQPPRGGQSSTGHGAAELDFAHPCENVGNTGREGLAVGSRTPAAQAGDRSPWRAAAWLPGTDGKARRFEPSIRLLAHGVPARVGKLRAYGNAIVPQVAAEVIGAYMEAYDHG